MGISDVLLKILTDKLTEKANELKGEVMIYELAQVVQLFLHEHNVPPKGSFYDEMMLNNWKRHQDRMMSIKEEEDQKRQAILDELEKRKRELEKAGRVRRESTRHSISENSPLHRSFNSSETSDMNKYNNFYQDECNEHSKSETIYFKSKTKDRKILRSSCLNHSQKGCIAYSGIDVDSGQLLYLTEWNVNYEDVDPKVVCPSTADEIIAGMKLISN